METQRIIDRLDIYLNFKGLSDNKVQTTCGIANGTFAQARRGKCDISKKSADKILSIYTDLSRIWLLTGEGEMLTKPSTNIAIDGHHNNNAMENARIEINGDVNQQLLDIIVAQQKSTDEAIANTKEALRQNAQMINKLIEYLNK